MTVEVIALRTEQPVWPGRKLRHRLHDLGDAAVPGASACPTVLRGGAVVGPFSGLRTAPVSGLQHLRLISADRPSGQLYHAGRSALLFACVNRLSRSLELGYGNLSKTAHGETPATNNDSTASLDYCDKEVRMAPAKGIIIFQCQT